MTETEIIIIIIIIIINNNKIFIYPDKKPISQSKDWLV